MATRTRTSSADTDGRAFRARAFATALLAALGLFGLIAATATSASRYAGTTVTIRAQGLDLSGFVSSSNRQRCAKGRVVTVFRQVGPKQNPRSDTRIASDDASLNGTRYMWSTGNTGQTGRLYARARRIRGCLADTSPTISVQQQP